MIIEILEYGLVVLAAIVQIFFVGMFILGFWNGFTYEVGKEGSKFHVWFTLLPFKRFFKRGKCVKIGDVLDLLEAYQILVAEDISAKTAEDVSRINRDIEIIDDIKKCIEKLD